MRTLLALTSIVASAVTLAHASAREQAPAASDEVGVAIRTFQFAPDTVRVTVGARVVWTNNDDIEHTITSGTPDAPKGPFRGVLPKSGVTYSAVLKEPGTYRYFCDRHRFMNGTVIVTR
jgi:plastocyanin